jgi:hypothetical protein
VKTSLVLALLALNLFLLVTNGMLSEALRKAKGFESRRETETEVLRTETKRLEALRARLEDKLHRMAPDGQAVPIERAQAPTPAASGADVEAGEDAGAAFDKPDLLAIPLMTPAEKEYIQGLRSEMPPILSEAGLLSGDIDDLLQDKDWNPRGRSLSPKEKEELIRLGREYHFFARLAPYERVQKEILPEVSRMKETGGYVDLPVDADAHIPGVTISHGEMPQDKPGFMRIYYFHSEDYPLLYHKQKVEKERALEVFVKAYHLINGSS